MANTAKPIIAVQPTNLTASPGQPAAFYAVASGSPAPAEQWQVQRPGDSRFAPIPGATKPSFHFSAVGSLNGSRYRAVFANSAGVSVTRSVTFTVRSGPPGAFVELIFSRSEVTAADACVPDNSSVARLDTTVAPYLSRLGLSATGSVETSPTQQSSDWCAHHRSSLAASWDQLTALNAAGWTFVDHSADYPYQAPMWSGMTPRQMWNETCGSAQVIDAHQLKGASDMYLWPNNTGQPAYINHSALASFVEPCFGTSRVYASGISNDSDLNTAPYRQSVQGANGGSCKTSGLPCSSAGPFIYRTPAQIIGAIQRLQPGQVLTLQVYVLVTGKNPAYTTNATRWDCTSANPDLHWTNDPERYCWTDLQQVLTYLVTSGLGITEPGEVNAAVGRTGYSDRAVKPPSSPA
jgi:hypothetical protein